MFIHKLRHVFTTLVGVIHDVLTLPLSLSLSLCMIPECDIFTDRRSAVVGYCCCHALARTAASNKRWCKHITWHLRFLIYMISVFAACLFGWLGSIVTRRRGKPKNRYAASQHIDDWPIMCRWSSNVRLREEERRLPRPWFSRGSGRSGAGRESVLLHLTQHVTSVHSPLQWLNLIGSASPRAHFHYLLSIHLFNHFSSCYNRLWMLH